MAITRLKHHDKCPVSVNVCKDKSKHYASLHCDKHNTHIQWLNREDAELIREVTKK